MPNLPLPHHQDIGDERAVTAPGDRLGAHERQAFFRRPTQHFGNPLLKLFGLHVVGKAAKTGIAPSRVDGIFVRLPQPTQALEVAVFDSRLLKRPFQGIGIKVWDMAGPRHSPHIYEKFDSIAAKKVLKLVQGSSGMADGINGTSHLIRRFP